VNVLQLEYQRQQLIMERQAFHLDQLRIFEARAKDDAKSKLTASGQLTQIMSFQEERFGKHANTHQFVKLPVLLATFYYPFRLDFSVISN